MATKKPSAKQLAARAKFVKMVRAKAAAKKKAAPKKVAAKKATKLHKDTKSHNVNVSVVSGIYNLIWTALVPIKGKFSATDKIKINKFFGSVGLLAQSKYPFDLYDGNLLASPSKNFDSVIAKLHLNNPVKKSFVVYRFSDKQFAMANKTKGNIKLNNLYIHLTSKQLNDGVFVK